MQTRKDLLQAHRLMTQRASLALILGQPDNPELPLRRLNVAAFCGVMIALLVMAAFGIWGLMRPGGAKGLEKPGMLLIEKETGARYVWCEGAKLCPVANYVSARLVAGGEGNSRRTVSRNSLSKFPRGPLIGIADAPNTLPDAKKLVKTPWSVCVRAVDIAVSGRTSMVSLVAGQQVGGQPLREDQALVIQANQQPWLIWKNRRLRVSPSAVATLNPNAPVVSGKWLNALPAGPDYKAPDVQGRGQEVDGPSGGKAKVGQFFAVNSASGTTWYVLLNDGLAPITQIEKELLRADPASKQAYGDQPVREIPIDPAAVSAAKRSAQKISNEELQGKPPSVVPYTETSPLCSVYDDPSGNSGGHVTINGRLPAPPQSVSQTGVDQLVFPPGGAALAGSLPGPGKASAVNTYFLVTEGRRYALKAPEVAGKLGYDTAQAVPVPVAVLGLIPNGAVLDPDLAARPLPGGPR